MRAFLSRRLLSRLERHTPAWVRRAEIRVLMNLASRSFGRKGPGLHRLSPEEALRAYAAFTVECMEQTQTDPRRLYECAFRLGSRLRRLTGLTQEKDLQALVFCLYRNLSIAMQGSLPGDITVPACYFHAFYTPRQCALMSRVDAGIMAGLFGGGSLRFSARLTEGCARCEARFTKEGSGLE